MPTRTRRPRIAFAPNASIDRTRPRATMPDIGTLVDVILSRDALYEQVWKDPVRRVAARLGISDVALAKACRKMRIPLPERGHWAKIEAGKAVRTPKLPATREGAEGSVDPLLRAG